MVTHHNKIHKKMRLCRAQEKRGGRDVNFFEKAHTGFHRKSKNRNLFGENTVGNEEGYLKRADSTVVLYCELELVTQVQLKTPA